MHCHSHLSSVQPSSARGGRLIVTSVSAEAACALLLQRFAAPGAEGLRELLGCVLGSEAGSPAPQQQQQRVEGVAVALATLADRAEGSGFDELMPQRFVPLVTQRLLQLLQERRQDQQQQQGEGSATTAAAFVADVLGRLCRRGHAGFVAPSLLHLLRPPQGCGSAPVAAAAIQACVAGMQDSAALERLVESFVREAAGVAGAARDDADAVARDCAAALAAMLPPATWAQRPDVRLLLGDKLLVQPQRLLPAASLQALLLYLHQAGAVSNDGCALADAAARVAQLWGDRETVQLLGAPQQAYLTAALGGALRLLSNAELEAHPQLLQLLLSGISVRLDSPLLVRACGSGAARPYVERRACTGCSGIPPTPHSPSPHAPLLIPLQAVRRQGMRVGSAMSRVLSPGKPALFAEDEHLLGELLPEERWEKAQQQQQQGAAPRASSAAAMRLRADRAANGVPPGAGKPAKVARRRRPLGSSGDEEEGVLTGTDSDDEGGEGGGGSSSEDGEFEAYDVEESDEDGEARRRCFAAGSSLHAGHARARARRRWALIERPCACLPPPAPRPHALKAAAARPVQDAAGQRGEGAGLAGAAARAAGGRGAHTLGA